MIGVWLVGLEGFTFLNCVSAKDWCIKRLGPPKLEFAGENERRQFNKESVGNLCAGVGVGGLFFLKYVLCLKRIGFLILQF